METKTTFSGLFADSAAVAPIIRFSQTHLRSDYAGRREELRRVWSAAGDFGLFRQPFPESVGGLGVGPLELIDTLEALGYGSRNNGLLFSFGAHVWAVIKPIVDFGNDQLKAQVLPRLMDGTAIGAHAASEFKAGSDVMAMTTRYTETADGFVLNGSKAWTTNAPIADLFVVFATSDPRLHFRGLSAFVVPADTPGLTVLPPERKIGLSDSPMSQVILSDCKIPKHHLLGQRHRGSLIFQRSLTFERGLILAPYLGVMRRQIEDCIEHANTRVQFGTSIAQHQAVSHRIAMMVQRYTLSKLITQHTAQALYAEGQGELFASLCKLTVSENICSNSQDTMRVFGAGAYMQDAPMGKDIVDSLGALIYSGTSDIQRNIICSQIGLGQG
jgi:alkylation response protein AidB-like acyl-CoA dehydrogenase